MSEVSGGSDVGDDGTVRYTGALADEIGWHGPLAQRERRVHAADLAGLALDLVRQHMGRQPHRVGLLGGSLQVASRPGRGTCFTLIVPRVAPAAEPAPGRGDTGDGRA